MCGIVGIWAKGYDRDHLRGDLEKAVASLHHRGPDDRGTWTNELGLALGHTRLSILDLSPHAHQPMTVGDGRYVISFNGEIYNFAELRERLASAGHQFHGSGDTEVVLHAFQEWGSNAVRQFIGMFAFALWDEQEQTLELVRDRVGVKPLYFGWEGGSLCFASELKALRHFRHWQPEVDRQALGEFLQYGYVPEDRTIYRGVHKLRPGHRLVLKRGRAPVVEPYWSLPDEIRDPLRARDEDIEVELESLLVDAFRYRMVSDVPVGVYLSGGIDSSLVTALLAAHHDRTIRTFTIGFAESTHDESRAARCVAEHCGTEHTDYMLAPREALEIARGWGDLFDEPFADSSSIPTLLISRLASRDVKVVLSADGGDELFSGYNSYTSVLERHERLGRLPRWLFATARRSTGLMTPALTGLAQSRIFGSANRRGSLARKLHRMNGMLADPTPEGLMDVAMSHWYPEQIGRLIGSYDAPGTDHSYPGGPAIQISLRDFHHYLPGDILTKVDRMTMAASIEGREPLLDHRLAEFAFRLPPHLRRGSLGPKHILKRILYRHVPRALVDRPKRGFAIPMVSWLNDEFKPLVLDLLSPERIKQGAMMDPRLVTRTVSDFYDGNTYLAQPLWFLLTFEMWRERWG